ncbi:GPI ethanolamine phosphate transferase 3 [Babesia ovis]|uniref:GPI ethanolamine phosphate transferase 3 n=1 Tax=Babesia ovis TaxID=5869 RepID=A0A9W5TBZ8_BABOV|nr:GPI ethanolamine phosphate transferase 3 [Babesia ovis]
MFFMNINSKGTFKPYSSDRFVLPFPPLFDEFELDSKIAVKSSVSKTRGTPESCWRRVVPEYETYIARTNGIFEYVPPKRFTIDGDMPPGWLSYTMLDSATLVILDGARADYALYDPLLKPNEARAVFTNHLPVYHEYLTAPATRNHCRFFRFEATPPTFTVYSLKCLLTGETRRGNTMGQSTSVQQLAMDNLGQQLFRNGGKICPLGDVVIYNFLDPDFVYLNYTGTGTDIYDMERPDCFVTNHYKECIDKCDLSTLHLLAIDHLGHVGKRLTSAMTYYLDDYDRFLRKVISHCSTKSNNMLFMFGDHGQKTNGSHGGGTKEEIDSFLFVKSDLEMPKISHHRCDTSDGPNGYARDHNVFNGKIFPSYPVNKSAHINMAVTLSLLLNKPAPYFSEGTLIKELIPLIKDSRGNVNKLLSKKYLTQLLHITSHNMLRTVDTTISDYDKAKYAHLYSNVSRERASLSHYYHFVRSMGRDQVSPQVMMDICDAYMAQCDRLIAKSKKLIFITNTAVTPEYIISSILLMGLAWMLSTYLALATWYVGHKAKLSEDESALFEAQRFGSLKNILSRGIVKLIIAILLSGAIAAQMEYLWFQESTIDSKNLVKPLSPFRRLLGPFERFCGLEEQPLVFYFLCYLALTFTILFTLDIPFFVRSFNFLYRNDKTFGKPLPTGDFSPHMEKFLSHLSLDNTAGIILVIYVVVVVKTLVSQCAILSHDTLLRHIVTLCLYFAVFPAFKCMGSLRIDGAHINLGILFILMKFCYLIHYFVSARNIGGMLPEYYVVSNLFLRTFEVGAVVITIFYISLILLLRGSKVPGASMVLPSPRKELYSTPTNRPVLYIIWTLQYLMLLFHYAVKCERHFLMGPLMTRVCMYLVKARNIVVARTKLGVYSARGFAVLIILVWLILVLNPWGILYPSNTSQHYRSTRMFWFVTNMFWSAFLLNGPAKSMGILVFAVFLYNLVALLFKLRVRDRITYIVLVLTSCELIYFVAGHQDSVFELDFDSAFLFSDEYIAHVSDIVVLIAFAIFNATAIFVLFYTYLLWSEHDYLSHVSEDRAKANATQSAKTQTTKPYLRSWILYDVFTGIGAYTYMACSHMLFVLSFLYGLSENPCAITDFIPKGVFSVGKTLVNLGTFWVLFIGSLIK